MQNPTYKILLVDDYQDFAQITGMMLRQYGCDVQICNSGKDCLRMARDTAVDVIFLDLEMPVLDGFSTCEMIRSQNWGKAVPIVALTGHNFSSLGTRLETAGFDGHLLKPATCQQYLEETERAIHYRRQVTI
jgi:CheY-like chemotaxis protein